MFPPVFVLDIKINYGYIFVATLLKQKRNQKRKIPHTSLERRNLCVSSYKNQKLKVNM